MTNPNEPVYRDDQIETFLGKGADYYGRAFQSVDSSWAFNPSATVFGSVWFGFRGMFGWALAFCVVEAFAMVQIGRGLFGQLGGSIFERIKTVDTQLALRREQLEAALQAGNDTSALDRTITSLESSRQQLLDAVQAAEGQRLWILLLGIALLVAVKIVQGVTANRLLEKRFSDWLSDSSISGGGTATYAVCSAGFATLVFVLTVVHFVWPGQIGALASFPAQGDIRLATIGGIEQAFEWLILNCEPFFDAITIVIRAVLDAVEVALVSTPWIVVALFIIALVGLSAGLAQAALASVFLLLIGTFQLWELAMQTLALLGTAALLSICLGIPIGIFAARRPRLYAVLRPILDFQQTMPAFVYMIPIIAFFGTGKPPAVITCMIFGMPPVIRLTVLGIRGVPETVREAAIAYGATGWYLLTRIDLPLAAPAIRAGMNQTIMLSLLTVVVASLIGAKGLGEDVLEALQYASIGQGILAGMAILFLAMILDRIVQGDRSD